jgi:hypothetical protein
MLHISLSSPIGCAALDGVSKALIYNGSLNRWEYTGTGSPGAMYITSSYYTPGTPCTLVMAGTCPDGVTGWSYGGNMTTNSCGPFSASMSGMTITGSCCSGNYMTANITE